ncbi:MAG: hypothetical protein BAJALOKI3v1_390031 [Promethearchaeota archaeon]|nr:MAG: hypothetical protein BAJALOKI3v1_390031 [Candidatus Lokiarchaeota archaeon]
MLTSCGCSGHSQVPPSQRTRYPLSYVDGSIQVSIVGEPAPRTLLRGIKGSYPLRDEFSRIFNDKIYIPLIDIYVTDISFFDI